MGKDATKIKPCEYSVKWNDVSIGYSKSVDLSGLKPKFIEKKIEEIGDIKIDDLYVGLEGTIKTVLKQVSEAQYRQLMMAAPGTGSIPGFPTEQYKSMYSLAKVLNFHPTHMGATLTEDFNVLLAVPVLVLPKSTEGKQTMDLEVNWMVYPDQTSLLAEPPVLNYFYIGEIPE